MKEFAELDEIIQDRLADPIFGVYCREFCNTQGISKIVVAQYVEEILTDVACEDISLDQAVTSIGALFEIKQSEVDSIFQFIVEALSAECITIIEQYPINKDIPNKKANVVPPVKNTSITSIKPDVRTVSERLFDALDPFKLHIDAQAIIAKEVDRYIRGETTAKDVGAYIAAHLDLPFSETGKIIEALNTHIFIPLKKTISEEKVLEIHTTDDELTQKLLGISPKKENTPLSFVPSELEYSLLKQKKDAITSHLQTVGGTPSGASLLSVSVSEEQKGFAPKESIATSDIEILPKKKYVVDPYKEIIE